MIRIGVGCLLGFLIIDITVVGVSLPDPAMVLSCRRWARLEMVVMSLWDLWECQSVSLSVWVLVRLWLGWRGGCTAWCNSISAPLIEAVVAGGLAGTSLSPPACMAPADPLISDPAQPSHQPNIQPCPDWRSGLFQMLPHLVRSGQSAVLSC